MIINGLGDKTRWCCRLMEFREVVSKRDVPQEHGEIAKATHERCVVCGNNHYILNVPPIHFGVEGATVG